MAKNTPIITQTEILAMAGRHIQQTILDLRAQAESLKSCVSTEEERWAEMDPPNNWPGYRCYGIIE